jgi:hypothetical protein
VVFRQNWSRAAGWMAYPVGSSNGASIITAGEEAQGDYAGWAAAQKTSRQTEMPKGQVIFRSNRLGR